MNAPLKPPRISAKGLSRRNFGKAAAGIVISFTMAPELAFGQQAAATAPVKLPGDLDTNRKLDAWLKINPDGTVEVFTGKVELGQGNVTALAQMTAEELDIAFSRIHMIPCDTLRSPNEGFTAGSASIEAGGSALRSASAEARSIMLDLAATKLGVSAASLVVNDGTITSFSIAGQTSYWEVAADGMLAREATNSVPPKPPAQHKLVGTSVPRVDIPAKVTGGQAFVQDMRLPGMLFGRVARPPSYNAQLTAFDDTVVRAMPGVVAVVRNGRFLGVVAEREEQAIAARAALQRAATWTMPSDLPDQNKIGETFKNFTDANVMTVNSKSPAAGVVVADGVKTITASYSKPYIAHASIGPSCSVAMVADGVMTVWSSTQGPYPLRGDIAKALGMPPAKVRVIHAQGSGCYGHNGADDAGFDAALLTQAVGGKPVKLQWMRDDEFAWEPFGSAMSMTAKASLAADGSIVDWQYDIWTNTFNLRPGSPSGVNLLASWHLEKPFKNATPAEAPLPSGGGDRNAVPYYDFPSQRIIDHFLPTMPLRVSALRTLGGFGNVFAVESFMDELAEAAGADPVEYRLRHLKDDRAKAVIQAVADRAGWKPGTKGDGVRGRGIAFCRYESIKTYIAAIADVVVDRTTGVIRVERITVASDSGQIISPDGLSNQIEGGIIQGTSWTLKEAVRFDRQRVLTRDWASYPIITFPEVPEVDVVLIDHPDQPSLGAGEASQCPTPAAIANAVYNAIGKRFRDLPLTPEKVKTSLV